MKAIFRTLFITTMAVLGLIEDLPNQLFPLIVTVAVAGSILMLIDIERDIAASRYRLKRRRRRY